MRPREICLQDTHTEEVVMRGGYISVSALVAAFLLCTVAQAAEPQAPPAPGGVKAAPYLDSTGPKAAQPKADAAPPAAAATEAKPADDKKEGDDGEKKDEEEKDKCRWCHQGKLGEAWTMPQPNFLKEHGINVSGWLD